jgi:Berberine and berberine like
VAKPYLAQQRVFNAVYPHSRHYYWKSHKLDSFTDEVIDLVVDQAAQVTSPLSGCRSSASGALWRGWLTSRRRSCTVTPPTTPTSWRRGYQKRRATPTATSNACRGSSTRWNPTAGVYVNFTSDDAEDRVRQTYNDNQGAPTYALKAKYDPTNFFRMNPTSRPAAGEGRTNVRQGSWTGRGKCR